MLSVSSLVQLMLLCACWKNKGSGDHAQCICIMLPKICISNHIGLLVITEFLKWWWFPFYVNNMTPAMVTLFFTCNSVALSLSILLWSNKMKLIMLICSWKWYISNWIWEDSQLCLSTDIIDNIINCSVINIAPSMSN